MRYISEEERLEARESGVYSVDLPDHNGLINYGDFDTREEAIKYAQEHFGADENGCVCLVSTLEDSLFFPEEQKHPSVRVNEPRLRGGQLPKEDA